jgi:hypothetical protein
MNFVRFAQIEAECKRGCSINTRFSRVYNRRKAEAVSTAFLRVETVETVCGLDGRMHRAEVRC